MEKEKDISPPVKQEETKKIDSEEKQAPIAKEEEEVPEFYESIPLLPMISAVENQNGLRHKDYQRYQRYCSRKIHKLRKVLKLTQGKHREYIKKEISQKSPQIQESSLLLTPRYFLKRFPSCKIFEIERYWAHAMHLKQKSAQSISDTKRPQKKMKEKFVQAAFSAQELLNLCKLKLGTDNTVLEAEAYYLYLQGQSLIESEKPGEGGKNYKEALKCMLKANELYLFLSKDKDALTQIVYKERMTQIEPFVRLTLFKLGIDSSAGNKELEGLKNDISKEVQSEAENIKKEKQIKQSANYVEVNYGGKTIPLNTEILQNLYKAITAQLAEVEKTASATEKIKEYSKLLSLFGKWLEEVRKEKTEEFKKSEASANIYNYLIDYTQSMKAEIVIKKIQLILSESRDKYEKEVNFEGLLLKKKNHKVISQIGKIVMYYSNILKKIKQIKNVEKDFNQKKTILYELQERNNKILLLYYKAQYFASKKKFKEGYYICQSILEDVKKAEEYYKANAVVINENKDKLFEEGMNIGKRVKKLKCLIHCGFLMKENKKQDNQDEPLDIKAKHSIKYKDAIKLIEEDGRNQVKLTDWGLDVAKAPKDMIVLKENKKKYKSRMASIMNLPQDIKKIKIFDLLTHMKELHVKPYLHDVAGALIRYPDIDAVIREAKEKQGGLMNKIKWLFGR